MNEQTELKDPWLIAAWPGMGNVAVIAAQYIIDQLGAVMIKELPANEFFQPNQVHVRRGIASQIPLPRSMIFEWRGKNNDHDLIIFLGEAQPENDGNSMCQRVLDYAIDRGVKKVFTFAALATQLHPLEQPLVFGAVTDNPMLNDLTDLGVEVLEGGQIGGLNGLMLAACAQRDIPAGCLLGELPFYASGIQNPMASKAVLKIFTKLLGVRIDFKELDVACSDVEEILHRLLERLKNNHNHNQPQAQSEDESKEESKEDGYSANHDSDEEYAELQSSKVEQADMITTQDKDRIEELFIQAEKDQDKAFQLKQELDSLGVFEQYQDRFLDLFKRAD
jgi:uncharacterized protein